MAQAAKLAKVIHLASAAKRRLQPPPTTRLAREERIARIVLSAIESDLSQADFFTREDLLQLRVLQSVATITRYQMVCQAVHWLIGSRRLTQLSRTELAIPVKGRYNHPIGATLISDYAPTVRRLITKWSANQSGPFDLPDLLAAWTTDPHLTTNAKRVVIRQTLKALRRDLTLRDGPRFMSFLAQEETTSMTLSLTEIHARLQRAFDSLAEVHNNFPSFISYDTCFALGEALGIISKAKALVGRDIDCSARSEPHNKE